VLHSEELKDYLDNDDEDMKNEEDLPEEGIKIYIKEFNVVDRRQKEEEKILKER